MSVNTLDRDTLMVVAENVELSDSKAFLTEAEKEAYTMKNMSLIYFVVNKFRNTKVDPDELESVGAMGFVKALNSFNKHQQVKFSTYAVRCIKNEILHLLRKERNSTSRNISTEIVLSIDKSGNELVIGDLLCIEECEKDKADSQIELDIDFDRLSVILQDLDENERFIIENRFGFGGQSVKTQLKIAQEIGISQANVSKIEKRVLNEMKKELICRFGMTSEEYRLKTENTSVLLEENYYVNKYNFKFRGSHRRSRYVNGCFRNS